MLTTLRTEADVAAACDDLATQCGWRTDRLEQRRASRIVLGLPDRRYHRAGQRIWAELKAPGGKLTADQYAWLLSELDAGALATVIDHPDQLARLFQLLGRRSASLEAAARDYCRDLVGLCWRRGPRNGKGAGSHGKRALRRERAVGGTPRHPAQSAPLERGRIASESRQTAGGRP